MFTNDCQSSSAQSLTVKFADDTSLVDTSNSDDHFEEEVHKFVSWCSENSLDLNVGKTQEMVIDFRRSADAPRPLFINGQEVTRVDSYKYLGTAT